MGDVILNIVGASAAAAATWFAIYYCPAASCGTHREGGVHPRRSRQVGAQAFPTLHGHHR